MKEFENKEQNVQKGFYCSTEEAVKKNWIQAKTLGGTECGTQCFWCK